MVMRSIHIETMVLREREKENNRARVMMKKKKVDETYKPASSATQRIFLHPIKGNFFFVVFYFFVCPFIYKQTHKKYSRHATMQKNKKSQRRRPTRKETKDVCEKNTSRMKREKQLVKERRQDGNDLANQSAD